MRKSCLSVVLALLVGLLTVTTSSPATAGVVGTTPEPTPSFDRMVTAMARSGNVLYVVGHFDHVTATDGTVFERHKAAALDATTGEILPWNPDLRGGGAFAVAVGSDGVYLGGGFTSVGGAPAGGLAKVARTDSAVLGLTGRRFDGIVRTLALSRERLYVGGDFTSVGAKARSRLAAFSRSGGGLLGWAPRANGRVRDVVARGWGVYVAGDFRTLNGAARDGRLSLVTLVTGRTVRSFNPTTRVPVFEVSLAGRRLYAALGGVGGRLNAYGRVGGKRLWTRETTGDAQTVLAYDGVVYVGGHFTTAQARATSTHWRRARLAAYDPAGRLLSWNPGADSSYGLAAMASLGAGRIAVGGTFNTLSGQPRGKFGILGS